MKLCNVIMVLFRGLAAIRLKPKQSFANSFDRWLLFPAICERFVHFSNNHTSIETIPLVYT